MEKSIFREKSVERVSSPEQLDAYLKVTSPKVWIILCGVIVLLIGFIAWGVIGKIETSEPTSCFIEDDKLYCYTVEETFEKIGIGTILKLNDSDTEYPIHTINYLGQVTTENELIAHTVNTKLKDHVYELVADCSLPNSEIAVKGKIVIETVSPIKFVFN